MFVYIKLSLKNWYTPSIILHMFPHTMPNVVHNVHRTFVAQSYNTDTKIHQVEFEAKL